MRKSNQFEDAYVFKTGDCSYPGHHFLKEAEYGVRWYDGKIGVLVPYVFYSRYYRKWKEDILVIDCGRYVPIQN